MCASSLSASRVFSSFSHRTLPQMSGEAAEEQRPSVLQILQIPGHVERSACVITCEDCLAAPLWLSGFQRRRQSAFEIISMFQCSASAVARVHVGDYAADTWRS